MDLHRLALELKTFEGLKRKKGIGALAMSMGIGEEGEEFGFGDDSAILKVGDETLLLACDGVISKLVQADPYFAGYSAVLVNLNDIAGMGGAAIAMVDNLSARSKRTAEQISRGMRDASNKFGVPIVGGHFNPNSAYDSIEIAVLGRAYGGLIRSSTAKPGDVIVAAIDLMGRVHPSYPFAWDSTSHKPPEKARDDLRILIKIAKKGLANSGRDISNPGLIGTIGMLLEQSGVGGLIDIDLIPSPPDLQIYDWIKMYPGYGFVFSAEEPKAGELIEIFEKNGISAAVIGEVKKNPKLLISSESDVEELFDFTKDGITGIKKW